MGSGRGNAQRSAVERKLTLEHNIHRHARVLVSRVLQRIVENVFWSGGYVSSGVTVSYVTTCTKTSQRLINQTSLSVCVCVCVCNNLILESFHCQLNLGSCHVFAGLSAV